MTFRTLLALSAAVLALTAGTVVGGTPVTSASAADDPSGSAARSDTARVSTAKLKRVDSIELDAESLVFRRGSRTVAVASMREPGVAVGLLNRLLGTPSRSQTAAGDGGACFPAGTTSTWGRAVRVAALTTPAPVGNAVEIRILRDEVQSRYGTDVELTGPDGVQVGDDLHDEIADAPGSDRVSFGSGDTKAWQLLLEPGWAAEDAPSVDDDRDGADTGSSADTHADDTGHDGTDGVSALTDDTTVTVLGSPMPVHAQRSC